MIRESIEGCNVSNYERRLEQQKEILVSTDLISGFLVYFEPEQCEDTLFSFLFNQVIEKRFTHLIFDVDSTQMQPCMNLGNKKYICRTKGLSYGNVTTVHPKEIRPTQIDFALKVFTNGGYINMLQGSMQASDDLWMGSTEHGVNDDDILILSSKDFLTLARQNGIKKRIKTEVLDQISIAEKRVYMDILKQRDQLWEGYSQGV